MTLLLATLWPVAAGAFGLGLVFGALGGPGLASVSGSVGGRAAALLLLAAAIGASALRLVPGRFGLWLDIALVVSVPYAAGCLLGALVRRAVAARRELDEPDEAAPAGSGA